MDKAPNISDLAGSLEWVLAYRKELSSHDTIGREFADQQEKQIRALIALKAGGTLMPAFSDYDMWKLASPEDRTGRLCEDCGEVADETWDARPYLNEQTHLCACCADKRRDHYLERHG